MTVFIIEVSGCEWGGVEKVAFSTREAAQEWIDTEKAHNESVYLNPEHREIFEVEVK